MSLFPYPLLMQLPLAEAGQLLLVVGISFGIITLFASYNRFQKLIQLDENELSSVESYNDFFFIQITRYLSKITRGSVHFVVLIAQFQTNQTDRQPVQQQLLQGLRKCIRTDSDKACLFREDCVAAILDIHESENEAVTNRLAEELKQLATNHPDVAAIRIGASTFPLHGQNSQQLVDAATDALEQADFEEKLPLRMAQAIALEEENPSSPKEESSELTKKDRHAALDPLTGVLKHAEAISYMRKYLIDLRRKKDPASILFIGINRIDNIISMHGEEAANTVICEISKLIQNLTRDSDLIGRYHRDDFIIMVPCSLEQGEMIALRLRKAVQNEVFLFEGKRIKCSISAGITAHPEHGRNLKILLRGAYVALNIIREWDTSSCLVYDPAQHDKKG